MLFLKCNNKRFVLYKPHDFTFSSTYIKIQSFFPETDVSMSAMVIWLNMKKPTIEIAKNDAWQTAFFADFICLTTRITATVFRSFVTNVLFLFYCYVTLHSQRMHSWNGNNKKNQIQHFSSLRYILFYNQSSIFFTENCCLNPSLLAISAQKNVNITVQIIFYCRLGQFHLLFLRQKRCF